MGLQKELLLLVKGPSGEDDWDFEGLAGSGKVK